MPKENRKRGRRADAKRKLEDVASEFPHKRSRTDDVTHEDELAHAEGNVETGNVQYEYQPQVDAPAYAGAEREFYGLLDEQEQEYFKRADDMLEANHFADKEEETLFLANVYKEADGMELKMACSQSCSRLLERLISVSSGDQLKKLFQKFSGHFLNLFQHRFASHCCETLFTQSAAVVTQELLDPSQADIGTDDAEPLVSMENLFLYAINELEGNLGFLMIDTFGSHTLRVLLTVISGQALDESSPRSVLKSKKKENVESTRAGGAKHRILEPRSTPQSFRIALEKMINGSILGLDTGGLRSLATHPIGNPMLQLLLQIEQTQFGKQRAKDEKSIIHKLLPDDPLVEGTESASFINNLVYEPVGSRLLETIIECAHGKMFKTLYREFFRDRMGALARNEIAGYVVSKIIERLSSEDLQKAHDNILPQIPSLAERGRTAIIEKLVERSAARGLDATPLAAALTKVYTNDDGETFSITSLLGLPPPSKEAMSPKPSGSSSASQNDHTSELHAPTKKSLLASPDAAAIPTTSATLHASLLAQAMLRQPGTLSSLIFSSLPILPAPLLLQFAYTKTLSPLLQASLTVTHAPIIFRRKLIQSFYSHICALSLTSPGSRLVDAIWAGTGGMAFVRERLAEELAENETALRESTTGKKVWRNWRMDLYKRRRGDWVTKIRGEVGNDGFLSFPGGLEGSEKSREEHSLLESEAGAVRRNGKTTGGARGSHGVRNENGNGKLNGEGGKVKAKTKTKLDLAREKFVKAQAEKGRSK